MYLFLSLAISYLLGSIPFSLIIGKLFFKKDVREYGSKNLGGTNAGRVLGKKVGLAVIALDHVKAILGIIITKLLISQFNPELMNITLCLSAIAIVLGHCYPIFSHFKGGKAVACTYGILFASNIYVYLLAGLSFLIILKLTKYVSLSSVCSSFLAGLLFLIPFFQCSPFLSINLKYYWPLTIIIIAGI
jgi:glycerol-3-phosphate acyltransferase PlsY